MQLSKLSSLVLSGLLLAGLLVSAEAQKKDKHPLPAPAPATPYSNVKRDNLLNGLQIVSLEREGDPMVRMYLVIRTGAMFDLVGKTGQAALTQESLVAANPRLKDELESLQARIDWGVNWDTTWFEIETPASNFDTVTEIFARLISVDNVRADAFKQALQNQIDKVKARRPSPAELADESFFKSLFGDHPYGHSIDGNEATLSGIIQGDVFDFLRRFYNANNASVVIVGNITHQRIMRAFKVFFGGWTKGQIIPATFRPPAQVTRLKTVKVESPEAAKVEIRAGMLGVKRADPDYLATEVLARVLLARLKKYAEASGSEFSIRSLPRVLPNPFYVSASVPPEQATAFMRILNESFAGLDANPVTDEELAAAKSSLSADYMSRTVEHYLREIEIYTLPKNYPLTLASKIEAITGVDLQRVTKKLIGANALTIVSVGKADS